MQRTTKHNMFIYECNRPQKRKQYVSALNSGFDGNRIMLSSLSNKNHRDKYLLQILVELKIQVGFFFYE